MPTPRAALSAGLIIFGGKLVEPGIANIVHSKLLLDGMADRRLAGLPLWMLVRSGRALTR